MDKQRMLENAVLDAPGKHGATFIEGFEALLAVIVYGAISSGNTKEATLKAITTTRDDMVKHIEARLDEIPAGEDFTVALSEQVKAAMAEHPEMKETMTEMLAQLRQHLDGVRTGKYAGPSEALDAMGAKPLDLDSPEVRRVLLDMADDDDDESGATIN
ncbi:hypothetical protein ABIF68_006994 [Bradyrhizobium japonicum]|uniref:Uncharacterized protein n=1 Tax=Bradyrhizobium barranii subsp. barranii TaxID=2823807 RepID=A0A939M7I1_9BRAD|nr:MULTISPECIES: hypothetical protein [Bradyrhizobium]MDI2077885.1 hypothetical protein [Bradyrhizobium sp. Mp27]UEM17014.1 hypothetical protein J4G43_023985 [Bradyrhizobium barranii subsp. barranii]